MFFKGRRRQKHTISLQDHIAWIERLHLVRLEQFRQAGSRGTISEFDKRQILAVNYEIAFHAQAARTDLDALEDMGEAGTASQLEDMRRVLSSFEGLSGIPRRDWDTASTAEVNQRWTAFAARRDTLPAEERALLLQHDMHSLLDSGIVLDVGDGLNREQALEAQRRMADVFREVDWAALLDKKEDKGD